MAAQERYTHPISLNKEQEDLVNRAREISGDSYSDLVVQAAKAIIAKNKNK